MSTASTAPLFQFELVSPEKVLLSAPVRMVVAPSEDGELGILAHHTPLLATLTPGVIRVTLGSGESREIFIAGGFADVSESGCTVLAEEATHVAALDLAALEKQRADLRDDLGYATDDPVKLEQIKSRLAVIDAKMDAARRRKG